MNMKIFDELLIFDKLVLDEMLCRA